jgi:DegV family protein with EDD domain
MTSPSRIAIVTDSTSDIPEEHAQTLNITVIPALLTIDGQTYRDTKDITRQDFYRRLPLMSIPPTTAVPSVQSFVDTYQRLLNSGVESILSIHLSTKLSGMIDVATQAAKSFGDRVCIFDSHQVSLGLGFQVMEAASAVRKGFALEDILEMLAKAREQVRLIAMINSQEYLKRSGRVGWLRAELGDLLRVRLIVEVIDGIVERRGLLRTRKKALAELVRISRTWGSLKRMAVLHSDVPKEAAELAKRIYEPSSMPPLIVDVTTLIGAHVGPSSLGIVALCR